MNFPRRLALLLCLLPALLAAEPAPLDYGTLSESWRARLAALAAPAGLSATFTETRGTPLKKKAVKVRGTVRLARGHGLSLDYDQPGAPLVILDEKGLLLRRGNGRDQAAPPEAEAGVRLLHALFAFDLATLEKSFALAGEENPDGTWSLAFTRRPDSDAYYQRLALLGDATRLTDIQLERTPAQRILIALDPPTPNPGFSPEELARYFR